MADMLQNLQFQEAPRNNGSIIVQNITCFSTSTAWGFHPFNKQINKLPNTLRIYLYASYLHKISILSGLLEKWDFITDNCTIRSG